MASRKEKRSDNKQSQEAKLQEQIKHWQLKVSTSTKVGRPLESAGIEDGEANLCVIVGQATDQTLELELLRAQKDSSSENLQSERETLISELESVQTSLHTLQTQNESFR